MSKTDYYELLGADRSASAADLKLAYRKAAMKYHPDRNPGDKEAEAKFKEVNEAYEILKDEQKRAAYDQYGHAAFEQGGGAGGPGGFGGGFGGGNFADIFEEMFGDFGGGRRGGGPQAQRGSDLRYNLEISLEEAFKGSTQTINIPTTINCDDCDGSGAAPGSKAETCGMCHGRGKVRAQQGFFTVERTCPTCHGQGQTIKDPCKSCHGQGRVKKDRTLQVKIPVGIEDGMRLRHTGAGEAGLRGAPAGDLYVFISIKPHAIFERDAADLHMRVPIPMTTAALGGSIEVPTLDGARMKVAIPAGAQSGQQFRLRGKGMSVLHGQGRGDLYVHAFVETPQNLNKRQKELLEEFAKETGDNVDKNSPESSSWLKKAKSLWEDLTD